MTFIYNNLTWQNILLCYCWISGIWFWVISGIAIWQTIKIIIKGVKS